MEITVLGDAQSPGQQLYTRLLAKRQRAPKTWSSRNETSPLQRSVTPAPVFEEVEGESETLVQEELAWYDRTVIWSRGAQVLQTYSFDEQVEDVVQAAFVWFPVTAAASTSSSGARTKKESAAAAYKGKAAVTTNSSFGPFTNSHQQQWGGPRGAYTSSTCSLESNTTLERTLVIFFRTFANIYQPSGETITTHLPFLIDGVWPLAEGGVVLQRSLERRERKRWAKRRAGGGVLDGMVDPDRTTGSVLDELVDLDDEVESLPRLYTLSSPRGEARPIAQIPSYEGGYLGKQVKVNSPTRPLSSEMSVVLVTSDPHPLLIAIDHDARELVFYRWARIPTETSSPQQKARSPMLSPLHGLQTHAEIPTPGLPKPTSRPSASRKRSSMGPSLGTDRRSSALGIGVADPLDRSTRRGSMQRQPRQSGIPETRSAGDILHATLEPDDPFKAAAARPVKGKRGPRGLSSAAILDDSRRVSGRLDLNRSMDRMALNVAEEADLRETTMMFGLERDDAGLASEVVTERIWSWPLPDRRDLDAKDLKAFLSDTRSHHHAFIHINLASSSGVTFYTFKLSLDAKATSYTITPRQGIQCQSSIPIISTRHKIPDVLLLTPSGDLELHTSNDQKMPVSLSAGKGLKGLSDAVGTTFTVQYVDGTAARCSLDRRPRDALIRACMEVLSLVLSGKDFFALKQEVILREATTWPQFLNVLRKALGLAPSVAVPLSSLGVLVQRSQLGQNILHHRLAIRRPYVKEANTEVSKELRSGILSKASKAAALLALHLLAENFRLSALTEKYIPQLVRLIVGLADRVRNYEWIDYWMRLYPLAVAGGTPAFVDSPHPDRSSMYGLEVPPDILDHLQRTLIGKPVAYLTAEDLPKLCHVGVLAMELGDVNPLSLTTKVIGVYRAFAPSVSVPVSAAARASRAIVSMVAGRLDQNWVTQLIAAVAIPVREALKIGQAAPPRDWPLAAYRLVGRSDQALQNLAITGTEFQRKVEPVERAYFTIGNLSNSVRENVKGPEETRMGKTKPETLPDIRFGADKRLQEVTGMLQTSKPRCIAFMEPSNADDAELLAIRTSFGTAIAQRTMAVTVGRAMFTYATRTAVITDAWVVPDLDLSVKLYPSNSVIAPTLPHEMIEWPNFHNGVAAALSIAPSSNGVDSSWIVFNKPAALSASHGGFLLGLGLSGHLRCMQTWHAYPYLEPRHDPTTIGLLLGLATSFAGSQDAMITKVISLHTQALLPLGSVELNASPCIQSAALMALGFVFVGSRSHRMADAVLKEISRRAMPGVENFGEYKELYAFSAAMAFGLIMLGQGGENSSHAERRMLDQLRRCISGENNVASEVDSRAEMVDPTYTAPGATLALGLMFLKSGRKDVIDMISIPQTTYALDHIRPDLLMMRTLARALIMWESVVPNMAWIEVQLPACIQVLHQDHKTISSMGLANELAYFNVVAGACFSIGLKYAGTATEVAHTTLMFFFGVFGKACANNTMSYEGKIRRSAARQGLNLITIALAMVMSGTGELNILRRLRVFHGQEGAGVSYGTHMAMHMACGILFLGHGRHTLGSSNMSIAAMCIACFPRFSSSPADNTSYLQAYRHLWALAVEPRCLIARDVDTRDTVYLPVKVRVMEGQRVKSQHLIAPTLVAPFERLVSIEVDSPRYWPVTYDILNNERDGQNLIRTGTIFVKRKAAFLDYNNDPKGNRSIFVRAGTMSRSDLFYDFVSAASPCAVSDEDFLALTNLHSGEPHVRALGEILCRGQSSSFVRFAKFALLECISLDKGEVFFDYLSFYCIFRAAMGRREAITTRNAHPPSRLSIATQAAASCPAALHHLRLLQTYYSPVVFDRQYTQTAVADKQATLFRPAFLSALVQELSDNTVNQGLRRDWFVRLDAALSKPLLARTDIFSVAQYLRTANVPPISLLLGLQQAVRRKHVLLESAGVSREEAMVILLGKMLETARKYDEACRGEAHVAAPGRAKVAIENCPGQWTVESARDALESWLR